MKSDLHERYEEIYSKNPVAEIEMDFESYRRNKILKKIYEQGSKGKILDIGAGAGAVSQYFKNLGYIPTAIEWTEAGAAKIEKSGIATIRHDVEKIPFPLEDNSFDEVFWGDNVEHLLNPEKTAKEIYRILKPGGRLVLSTPNHGWIINRLYYALRGVPRKTEGHEAEIWNWTHIRYFNSHEIKKFLKKCGFEKICVYGTDQRKIFEVLSGYYPSLCSSVLVVTSHKETTR